ncbi:hypothetical protein GQX73_g8189 [Xylaria multiplex]|uniref:C2H2-type domain-containing protein n=1 Tax=Xylaria multiplex TaxID=323545 RepID=A0A7C8IPV1_9PEZI|nr:hypothetical protein GQX73_g8189 [Xylaria multiplex]
MFFYARSADCAAEFSRKDHAKRHKLSHSQPRFACPHPNCGLFFHRRDVLRRHEAVHRPENAEKRRRPRRGPLPRALPRLGGQREREQSLPASESHDAQSALMAPRALVGDASDASTSDHRNESNSDCDDSNDGDIELACLCHVPDGTVCVRCSSELVRLADGRLSPDSQAAIKFCMTHYIQSQLKWFPFILPSSLRTNWLINGRALILAALGARTIKEYKALAGGLWVEAVRVNGVFSSVLDHNNTLSNFQTKILLLDYLQWNEYNTYPTWVKPMLDQMNTEARELVDMLTDVSSKGIAWSVEDELCQQEIRWTLWKFYCTITQTTLLGLEWSASPPRLFQTLDLPGDLNQLLTLSECARKENDGTVEKVRGQRCDRSLTLPQALSIMLDDDHKRAALPDILSMTDKYILLHAILYLADNMVEDFADVKVIGQDPVGWQVETRERVYLLVMRWRQCFWIPPEVIWKTKSSPEFCRLQSVMFVIYLAVRLSQPICGSTDKERCSRRPYSQYAMRCIETMHINMKNNNLTEVAAIGRWFLDGSTWRTGGLTAAYLIEWFRDRSRLGFEDEDIDFMQSIEGVMALYSHVGSYNGLSYSPARLAQLERSVKHLWTMILGTETAHSEPRAFPQELLTAPSHT